jgi:hypothetical protein
MEICADARPFYGDLYRIHANLAMSINNKCHYNLLWLYGLYTVLHSLSEIEQVLLMRSCNLVVTCRRSRKSLSSSLAVFPHLLTLGTTLSTFVPQDIRDYSFVTKTRQRIAGDSEALSVIYINSDIITVIFSSNHIDRYFHTVVSLIRLSYPTQN